MTTTDPNTPALPSAIEHIPTGDLVPYARNSRTHSPEQVAQLGRSMREFGFTNPVLIDEHNTLIAGHGRVMAAQSIGLAVVPAIRLTHLSDAQRRAYVIADNKLAEQAGWDMATLAREVEDLQALDFDVDLLGFGGDELAALLGEHGDAEGEASGQGGDADAVPEPAPEPVSVLGDVWVLGKHRVMCGDSTSTADVRRLMTGKRAALIHADPPYGMGFEAEGVANDNLYFDKLADFQVQWWRAFLSHCEGNASAYVWGWEDSLFDFYLRLRADESQRITKRNYIVWNKKNGQGINQESLRRFAPVTEHALFFMLGEQGFNNNADNYWEGWEPIRSYLEAEMKRAAWSVADLNKITGTQMAGHWVTKSQWSFITKEHYAKIQQAAHGHDAFKRDHDAFKRDHDALKRDHDALKRDFYATRAYFDNTHDAMTDVWDFQRVTGADRHGHATPKPVAMMERIMRSSLPPGGLCAEPFGGSGSTLMGAEVTGRVCYTMELQPRYVDVILKRWQTYTGQQAVHEATGKTFAQLQAERLPASAAALPTA